MLSYIEISRANLINNLYSFKKLLPEGVKIVSVIKANAYGHGLKEVAKILENYVDYFQVDDIEELKELRSVSDKECFVFGYIAKEDLCDAIKLNGTIGITSIEQYTFLEETAKKLQRKVMVHICVDSALGRDGFLLKQLNQFLSIINKSRFIEITGIYSHFANIEDTPNFSHAKKQIKLYERALKLFSKFGYKNLQKHISSTAVTLVYETKHHGNDLVRLGIGQYGIWPSEYLYAEYLSKSMKLEPVLRWVSHIAQIKELPKGSTIGYGLTYTTTKKTKIAVIPQGYSDGYDRKLSNIGEVLINGNFCRVLGRVSMNMMVVDVSHLKQVKIEDEVVLLGKQGSNSITSEMIAEKAGTINYEVIARISPLLPRLSR